MKHVKTNVTYLAKDFYINKEKATVACKLQFMIDLNNVPNVMNFIELDVVQDFLANFNYNWEDNDCECCCDCECCGYDCGYDAGYVTFEVSGKSKASGSDVFNEQLGKYVSLSRAQEQAFLVAEWFYNQLSDTIKNYMTDSLDDLAFGSSISAMKCASHVEELLEPYMPSDDDILEKLEESKK